MGMAFCLISSVNASDLTDSGDDTLTNIQTESPYLTTNTDIESELITMNVKAKLANGEKTILSDSNSIYVSTDGEDKDGCGSESNPYKSLEYAINNSKSDSTIYMANGTYTGNNNRNITINKTLTLIGDSKSPTIIDAESQSRLFSISQNTKLTIINLILSNGHIEGEEKYGGTIFNEGGELTIINSTISNSTGSENGGAIYNNLGKLKIYNSNIINNSAAQYGGAIYTLGENYLENTNFTGNFIINEKGVGACLALGGTGTFNNCNFIENRAIYSAAGILNLGNITINNCNFINLTTNYTGGAISNHNYALINNSYFGFNEVRFYAAAILAPPSGQHVKTEVYNTIFEFNHAGNHAAVSNNFKDTELLMKNCALLNNYIISGEYFGDISLDDNATLEYCWWGQNQISPYYYSPHSSEIEPWKINASRWLIMTFTSSNGVIYQDKDNILTVSIKQYFDNETKEICEYNEDINLPLKVKFYAEGGRVIKTMQLVNGTAQITFNPKSNLKAIYATIDNQTLKIDVNDKENCSIIAEDLVKTYKNDSQLEVKLLDKNNQALENKNIIINIVGKNYTVTTNKEGIAKLNINLLSGNYTAIISLDDNDYRSPSKTINVTVLKDKTSIVANDLVKYYRNSTQLVVKLVNKDNKPVANKIVINVCNKNYVKLTNEKGIATLNINLLSRKYTAKITFRGDSNYNASSKSITINVIKPKLTALKTKLKNKKDQFTVSFKDANGKIIKNTKVKFTLNGKTYIRTTNYKGQASIPISLKVGKWYNVKTSFQSTKTYGETALITKIKVD